MKNLSFTALLLLTAALSSCETTVDLPEPPHTPRVALAFTLSPNPQDSSFAALFRGRQLYISNSQSAFDTRQLEGRTDATVDLHDDAGQVVERYRPRPSGTDPQSGFFLGPPGYYKPVLGFRPQVGKAYTLRATLPGFGTAESTLTLPAAPVVESGTYTPRTAAGPNSGEYTGRLSLVLRDDPATANYYLAFARLLDKQGNPGNWSAIEVDYDSQSNTAGSIGQFQLSSPQQEYSVYPFADTDVNGQRIVLASDVRFYTPCFPFTPRCPEPGFIEVYVSSITADTYNFYLSRRRYYDSDGNPFAEPAPLASNVRNGYGIFGGATEATFRIPLP
ncbi:DUF4249 domain-containing protein [Hymenobacter sp. 5317J-9]|uniref:DUF4249 domain-containing protein n=1 Tax=Hymenobacter sp. 5317J-9 TaxID=2932250 RepID=UPI001FD67D30|nr:DUF4249 domain-containing protein [Hymenobacter sp. 5317J-9]UOQ97297.1 DUF4249 domain-containing protein [Hymenobacter sp. 5317J-9]